MAKKKETHTHNGESMSDKFSSEFLMGAVLVLGVISLIGSYIMGYQQGLLTGGYEVAAPSEPKAAVVAAAPAAAAPSLPPPPSVPKSETPEVELFVMSECPFGLQMEKALVPVAKLLGDQADVEVKWVSYAMHELGEIEENTRQYCIQQEQESKYIEYLECYLATSDSTSCQQKAGINTAQLNNCVDATNNEYNIMEDYNDKSTWLSGRFPQYNVHKDLNEQYGVQGSPTLVINGQKVTVQRSPEALKQAICNAFENAPEECEQELSALQEAPGHGVPGQGAQAAPSAAAGCGV